MHPHSSYSSVDLVGTQTACGVAHFITYYSYVKIDYAFFRKNMAELSISDNTTEGW
jgi:hypothetical protein